MQDYDRGFLQEKAVRSAVRNAIAAEIQQVEDLLHSMRAGLGLDDAEGVQLDNIYGKLVNITRLGRTDDEYRAVIRIAIRAYDSDGGIDDVLFVASGLVGEPVRHQFLSPGNCQLAYETSASLDQVFLDEALYLIEVAMPSGVSWYLVESSPVGEGKNFDGGPDGRGFEDHPFARVIGGSSV
jgi:hypothetical protein